MEILTSGSFINLENQGKIEQLIYTAKEIANAAVETDGFVNSEENNQRLALEIWQGAEYMCRDFEEANIKNIFINNFLERLREIRGAAGNSEIPLQTFPIAPESIEKASAKDEFLGIVETNKIREPESSVSDFSSNETDEETSVDEDFQSEMSDSSIEDGEFQAENSETDEFLVVETMEETEEENENSFETLSETETVQPEEVETLNKQNGKVSSIALPEKEPYRWDNCTVTATIQMLPDDAGIRRVVLSVRTHDFAPQISVVELTGEVSPENLLAALETAFDKYKNDLPIKVMDKLKKEKSSVKRQSSKTTTAEVKTSGVSNTTQVNNKTVQRAEVKTAEKPTPKVTIPKPENTLQGNLFG